MFLRKSKLEDHTLVLTTMIDLNVLEQMATTYNNYKRHKDWIKQRSSLDGGQGGFYIDRLYEETRYESIYRILMLIASEIWKTEESAEKKYAVDVCEMLQILYDKEPTIRKNINTALKVGDSETAFKYLESKKLDLKGLLITIATWDPLIKVINQIKEARKEKDAKVISI